MVTQDSPPDCQNRAVSVSVSRQSGCLSPPVREPENREGRVCSGLRQRMGSRRVREAENQMRGLSQPPFSSGDRRGHPMASFRSDRSRRDFVAGIYPMLLDETCYFLAADFDRERWREDAGAFMETCRRLSVPAALERSRSGNGGHVWLFFEEAISASLARKLGSHILTETMERRPEIGLRLL